MQPTLPDDDKAPAPGPEIGGAGVSRSPLVIVHHLAQANAALEAADRAGINIQLRSAPGAAAFAGVGYLKALGDSLGHELLIDCGDDPGLVMAALRTGAGKLVFSGPADAHVRLRQMADKQGAQLLGPDEPQVPCLYLSPDDDGDAVYAWLCPDIET
ncbi:MAG: hypothetical protein AAGC99_16480 [Pseudomonadota bacterium]